MFLMPGMVEGHAHLSFESVTSTEDLITPPPEEHTLLTARVAKILLDHGFTSAYGASEAKLRLGVAVRNEVDAGRLPGPRIRAGSLEITVTGGLGDESKLHNPRPGARRSSSTVPRRCARPCVCAAARAAITSSSMSRATRSIRPRPAHATPMAFEEIRMAVETAHNLGRMVNAHARSIGSIQNCVRAGVDVLYHCEYTDEQTLDMLEEAKDRIFVAPTISLFHTMLHEAAPWVTPEVARAMGIDKLIDESRKTHTELRKRGIRHVIGGDYGFAWSKNGTNARDVGFFVEYYGYSPAEALRCATRNGGALMTMTSGEKLGEVREGLPGGSAARGRRSAGGCVHSCRRGSPRADHEGRADPQECERPRAAPRRGLSDSIDILGEHHGSRSEGPEGHSKKPQRRGPLPGRPSTQEIIAADKVSAPEWVRSESYQFLGDEDISHRSLHRARLRQGRARAAVDPHLAVCLPRGEHSRRSATIRSTTSGPIRSSSPGSAPNDIRAYYNACLHRGTKLRASGTEGRASEFQCSFHGWSWNIDGTEQGRRLSVGLPACGSQEVGAARGPGGDAGRLRVHQHGPGCALVGRVSRAASSRRHIDAWKLEDRYVVLARREKTAVQLEAGDRGVPGGLSRHQDPPAGGGIERRCQFAVRRLRRACGSLHLDAGRAEPASLRQAHGAGHSRPVHAGRQRRARRHQAHVGRRRTRRARSWRTCSAACSRRRPTPI